MRTAASRRAPTGAPGPQYGLADLDLLQWIALPTLDPRARPWNTAVLARGTNFFLQTTDISVSPFVNVAAGQLLDAGLGPVTDVPFNAVGGGGPYNGSFNVLPVRVFDDPAQSDPYQNVTRIAGLPPQWDVTVNFLLQYGAGPYTVELDSDYDGTWNSPPNRVYQIDGDTVAPGVQQFAAAGAAYSRVVRIPNTHPAGGFSFAIRVTDALGAQYVYAWADTVWLYGPPAIDARTLANARFTVHNPGGGVLINNRDTDVVYDASAIVALGASYYVDFQLDGAAAPNDRALYPARPSVAGVVQYTAQGLIIDPALTPYFDTTDNGYTLHLRPGAYNRITNDVDSLRWANYAIIEDTTGTTIMAARATNTSAADNVVLRANINYRPRFVALAYPTTGSNLRAETIYPTEFVTGYITTGFGGLSEGGSVLGGYFDQAGLLNTMQADAYCRFESEALAMGAVNYGFVDATTAGVIVPGVLNPAARPYDALALARGTVFFARDAALNNSGNVTVGAGQQLNGATSLNLPLGLGALNLNVLPVRVFDNPALSDPHSNVSQAGSSWNVICNFLIQYGTANYTVQLDSDWGGAWNDGVAGRIRAVPGSPYGAPGVQSRTVNIPSASQPAGTYAFAIRVTDSLGAVYTYVWPGAVRLDFGNEIWWTFGHDRQHTHRSSIVGAQSSNVKWIIPLYSATNSSPSIGPNGTIYIGSSSALRAVDINGNVSWIYMVGGDSTPAVGLDGSIYVGGEGSGQNLTAINPDGSLRWRFLTASWVHASPTIATDGTIYIGCGQSLFYAINPDGSQKWTFATGDDIYSCPAIGIDDTVYFSSHDHNLYALEPSGLLKWVYSTGDEGGSSPALGADGTIYVGSSDNHLYAVNPDGSLKWTYLTGDAVESSPAIGADGTVYVGSNDAHLYAINPDGSLKWQYATAGTVHESSPAIGADGIVYVGGGKTFYAINADGSLKWLYTTGDFIRSSPAIGVDGTVYVGSNDGNLYAFGA